MKYKQLLPITLSLIILSSWSTGLAQTTLTTETSNNTAACSAASGYCKGAFAGMSSSSSGVFNPAPGNTSHQDMHEMEYSNATTAIYAHFLPWFCMQAGSTATGPGTSCNSHIQVGYNSNDSATVKAQMDDMGARGIKGPIIDWYGPNSTVANGTTQLVRQELEGRCSGGSCDLQFGLMEDEGSITRSCPENGGGIDQTTCITNLLESDFDYMNANYFPSPAYVRVDASTMKPSAQGRPAVFFFICESCFTNPSPNWTTIFASLRQHVIAYKTGAPLIWFIFRNAGAFTHVESDGGFAWINHYGSNDPFGLVYLDNFYDTALKYPKLQPWGAGWKGFDNSLAPWKPALSVTGQQCGNTWLQTFAEMTHNNDYNAANQLPFLQIVSWNDYEEGTEIETGIDNCLALTASTDGTNLSWTPTFSGSGNENTVHHYQIFDSTDGQTLTPAATVPPGTHAIPLSSMTLSSGQHTFYVEAVGKASILNKMSNAVAYSNTSSTVSISGVSPVSGSTLGGTAVTITGQGFQSGATVSFGGTAAKVNSVNATSIAAVTPAHAAGAVNVTVTNSTGTGATRSSAFTYVAPYFALSASPTSKTVKRGTTAAYSISVAPHYAYTGTVTFSLSGLPSGATASFSPASVTTSGTTKLSVYTKRSVRGTFTLTAKGTDSTKGFTSSVNVTLTVK